MAKGFKTGGRVSRHPHRINFCVDEATLAAMQQVMKLRNKRTGVDPMVSQVWREAVALGLRSLESTELRLAPASKAKVAKPPKLKPAPKKSTRSKTAKKSAKPTKAASNQPHQGAWSDETLDAAIELSWRRKRFPAKADVRSIAQEINRGHEPNWANAKERQRFAKYCRENRIRLKLPNV